MERRTRVIVAGTLAVLCAILVYRFLSSLRPGETVVVATKPIPTRTLVTADMLRIARVDSNSREVLAPDAYHRADQLQGMVAARPIAAGEVLRTGNDQVVKVGDMAELAKNERVSLSHLIPPDMRAVVVPIQNDMPVREGDRIDLFDTAGDGSSRSGQANLLLAGVSVFAVDRAGDSTGPVRNITILVKAGEDVRRVVGALAGGGVDLVLAPVAQK